MKHLKRIFEALDNKDLITVQNIFSYFTNQDFCETNIVRHGNNIIVNIDMDPDGNHAGIIGRNEILYRTPYGISDKNEFKEVRELMQKHLRNLDIISNFLDRLTKFGFHWSITTYSCYDIEIDIRRQENISLEDALFDIDLETNIKKLNPKVPVLKKVLKDKYGLDLIGCEWTNTPYGMVSPEKRFQIRISGDQSQNDDLKNDLNKVTKGRYFGIIDRLVRAFPFLVRHHHQNDETYISISPK